VAWHQHTRKSSDSVLACLRRLNIYSFGHRDCRVQACGAHVCSHPQLAVHTGSIAPNTRKYVCLQVAWVSAFFCVDGIRFRLRLVVEEREGPDKRMQLREQSPRGRTATCQPVFLSLVCSSMYRAAWHSVRLVCVHVECMLPSWVFLLAAACIRMPVA
jgi:hypothetical protein